MPQFALLLNSRRRPATRNAHFRMLFVDGEWVAFVDTDDTPLWDDLDDAWKISYHTGYSMIRVARSLLYTPARPPVCRVQGESVLRTPLTPTLSPQAGRGSFLSVPSPPVGGGG